MKIAKLHGHRSGDQNVMCVWKSGGNRYTGASSVG